MKIKLLLTAIVFLAFVLRFFNLGSNPPSLYWDEASLGYNAFSIAQTGHDEHGEFLPITRFIAFGDYKPPGYIYAAALAVKLFGLNEFSVRLPSALAGTLLVLVTFFLTKELLGSRITGLLACFFVAVSPWSLQMSRGAFEANLATLFSGTAIYLFLKAISSKKSIFFFISSIFFVLAMYTFNSHKIFVPLIIVALLLIFRPFSKKLVLAGVLFFLLLLPLTSYSITREARLRFDEVSWTKDLAPVELSNQRVAFDGGGLVSRLIHNRRVWYAFEFIKHYTDIFSVDFLFFNGDENPRLSIQTVGELYLVDLPLLLVGLFFLIKNRNRASAILFVWALLAPIPAAFARETPHALRTLNILSVPQIIVAVGLVFIIKSLKRLKILKTVIMLFYVAFLLLYLRDYYLVYPKEYSFSWQYGYKQMVEYVLANQSKYDRVSVTGHYGRPYIYFLLHGNYPPERYWSTRNVERDWFGFWYVHGFGKYIFNDALGNEGRWLYVRAPKQSPQEARMVTVIKDLKNEPIFELSEKSY